MVALGEAQRLRIWNLAELTGDVRVDHALLIFHDTNLKAFVLGLEQNLMAMQTVEGLCGVLSG